MAGELIQTFRRTLARIAEIEKRMNADRVELATLRREIDELREALNIAPSPSVGSPETLSVPASSRPLVIKRRAIHESSTVGWARRVLELAGGESMYIDDIIKHIEHMSGERVSKATLVSNLCRYVKTGDTFRRTAANTFALIQTETPKELELKAG